MQIQITQLDGSKTSIQELAETGEGLVAQAISASEGAHVVIGENLTTNQNQGDVTAQIFHIFASNGILIATNLVP